jgi:hypothetical protein
MKFPRTALALACTLMLAVMALSSCATSVPVTVDHPPSIAMGSIKSVAVQDFMGIAPRRVDRSVDGVNPAFSRYESGRGIAALVTDEFRNLIKKSRSLGLFDYAPGRFMPGAIPDAVIGGEVTDYTITTSVTVETRSPSNAPQYKVWVTRKEMSLGFVYTVIEYATGRQIDKIYKRGSDTRSDERREPTSVYIDENDMTRRILGQIMPGVERELLPWSETVYLSLEGDDRNPNFKRADDLVKNRQYDAAVLIYMDEYNNRQNFKAGYNAALLIYAMGDRYRAMDMMKTIAERYGFSKARDSYNWMRKTDEDEQKLRQASGQP